MEVKFNVTGKERKALVTAIAEITGATATYKGVPSCAYEVDYFTIDRFGALSFNDMADSEEIEGLLEKLEQMGFHFESTEYDEPQPDVDCEEPLEDCPPAYGEPEDSETVGLTVAMPLDKVAAGNLTNLLEAKGSLIKKALGICELPIEFTEEKISFPWFKDSLDANAVKAYTNFIAALCKMSKEQKRISNIEKPVENEKYAFRCLLLRLGFVGAEYKIDRKILLKNLIGSSAFKNGAKKEAADEVSE